VLYPKKLEEDGEEIIGICWRRGRRIEIRVRSNLVRREFVETLLHEWTHAHVMRHSIMEKRTREKTECFHDNEFWLAYGRIYEALYDAGGREEILESIRGSQ
jgi:hypothetical protein